MTARNRAAFARGQAIRAVIHDYLLEHAERHPFSRRPTWREIQMHLHGHGLHLERAAIYWHVRCLEVEATDGLG
jgi:hypothetical protein